MDIGSDDFETFEYATIDEPLPTDVLVPDFIDDNPVYDDLPYLACGECNDADVVYDEVLSLTVNINRYNTFVTRGIDCCQCNGSTAHRLMRQIIDRCNDRCLRHADPPRVLPLPPRHVAH